MNVNKTVLYENIPGSQAVRTVFDFFSIIRWDILIFLYRKIKRKIHKNLKDKLKEH